MFSLQVKGHQLCSQNGGRKKMQWWTLTPTILHFDMKQTTQPSREWSAQSRSYCTGMAFIHQEAWEEHIPMGFGKSLGVHILNGRHLSGRRKRAVSVIDRKRGGIQEGTRRWHFCLDRKTNQTQPNRISLLLTLCALAGWIQISQNSLHIHCRNHSASLQLCNETSKALICPR